MNPPPSDQVSKEVSHSGKRWTEKIMSDVKMENGNDTIDDKRNQLYII